MAAQTSENSKKEFYLTKGVLLKPSLIRWFYVKGALTKEEQVERKIQANAWLERKNQIS